jgi:hypothetical protein
MVRAPWKERNTMQNFYATWQVLCSVALSCALNGIGVAIFTLLILAWNNCGLAPGRDDLAGTHAPQTTTVSQH